MRKIIFTLFLCILSISVFCQDEFNVYSYIKSSVSCPETPYNFNTKDGELWFKIVHGVGPYDVIVYNNNHEVTFDNIYDGVDTGKYWNSNNSYNGTLPVSNIAQVNVDSVPAGDYYIKVLDKSTNIYVYDTITMTFNQPMENTVVSIVDSECDIATGTVSVSTTGGKAYNKKGKKYYLYEWNNDGITNNSSSLVNLSPGNNILKVYDSRQCVLVDTFLIRCNGDRIKQIQKSIFFYDATTLFDTPLNNIPKNSIVCIKTKNSVELYLSIELINTTFYDAIIENKLIKIYSYE